MSGISQVLFSMPVIELSPPGLEATTYELLITVSNAASTYFVCHISYACVYFSWYPCLLVSLLALQVDLLICDIQSLRASNVHPSVTPSPCLPLILYLYLSLSVPVRADTVSGIIGTQLLTPLKSVACTDGQGDTAGANATAAGSSGHCNRDTTVNIDNASTYEAYDGPSRYSKYTLVLIGISIGAVLMFTQFLPKDKAECAQW